MKVYTGSMGTILIIVAGVVIFIIGIISPHTAGKIQRKTDQKASRLKDIANWCWDPITWWAQKSIEVSRKLIVKIAAWGKKTRYKFSRNRKR